MGGIEKLAPVGAAAGEYDRRNLALYAALLDADEAGVAWQEAAALLMSLDVSHENAEQCWRSHLERARWIIGAGLGSALATFGAKATS